MWIKPIPSYPGYMISEEGSVFSNKSGKIKKLKPSLDKDGYQRVYLCISGKVTTEKAHRLVLMAFDRMPKPGEVCRHFPDRDINNNHISNLQWGSRKENTADMKTHNTFRSQNNENNGMCKLTNKEVLEIRDLYKTGSFTQKDLGEKYKVAQSIISNIVNNKSRTLS